MRHSFSIRRDRDYFGKLYDQVKLYGSRMRRFERIAGVLSIAFGLGVIFYFGLRFWVGYIPIVIGFLQFFQFELSKPSVVRRQLRSKGAGTDIKVVITEEGLQLEDDVSSVAIKWEGVDKRIQTPEGMLLKMGRAYIFMAWDRLSDEAIKVLLGDESK